MVADEFEQGRVEIHTRIDPVLYQYLLDQIKKHEFHNLGHALDRCITYFKKSHERRPPHDRTGATRGF